MSDKKLLEDKMPMIPTYRVLSRVQIMAETVDYNHRLMNVPSMWKHTKGEGVKVVVLDTGCPVHIDLNPCGNKSFIPNYPNDKNGHSTHVGGIIAAIANNGMGVAGIAPDCEDWYGAVLDGSGSGSIDDIIRGIRWATDEVGAQVINMSLGIPAGIPRIKELEDACNYARSKGVLVVCAAGNEASNVGQPAMYDSVLAIAAVDDEQEHARFSNTGKEVDFAAGGVNVFSTYLNNSYAKLSGTSMSSPALTGIAALIIADEKKDHDKWLTPDETIAKLKKIAFDIGPNGYDEMYGFGIPVFANSDEPVSEQPEQPDEPVPPEEPQSPCKIGLPMVKAFLDAAVKSMDKDDGTGLPEQQRVADAVGSGIRAAAKFAGRIDRQGRGTPV